MRGFRFAIMLESKIATRIRSGLSARHHCSAARKKRDGEVDPLLPSSTRGGRTGGSS